MKTKIETVRDETIKGTGTETISIDIKCKEGKIDEHKQRKSVICITLNEDAKDLEAIVAGSFSPRVLMAYIEGLDTLKKEMIKKLASTISDGLGDIMKKLDEEDE